MIAAAMAFGSCVGTTKPVTSWSTTSGMPPAFCADDRLPAGHRVEDGRPEPLGLGAHHEHVEALEQREHVGTEARKEHVPLEMQVLHLVLERLAQFAFAEDDERVRPARRGRRGRRRR